MAPRNDAFHETLIGLWFRLTTIFASAFWLALAIIYIPAKVTGWSYYLTLGDISYELLQRAIVAGVAAALLAAFFVSTASPFLYAKRGGDGAARSVIQIAAGMSLFGDISVALAKLGDWAGLSFGMQGVLVAANALVFALCLFNPKMRGELTCRFDGVIGKASTRRTVLAIAAGLIVIVFLGRSGPGAVQAQHSSIRPRPNILLVTFDAMAAEDLSAYGYGLPTTPNLAEFASKASLFTNFYSSSTFTTPCAASLITGLEPSETGVFQLYGRLRGAQMAQMLPRVLHDSGYATAALSASPMVYFLNSYQGRDFDLFPEPVYFTQGFLPLWEATGFLHPRVPFGGRLSEFQDMEWVWRGVARSLHNRGPKIFDRSRSLFPPSEVFAEARELIGHLPKGYFVWVHVMAPHAPYLPVANLGRFLPGAELRTVDQQRTPYVDTYPANDQPEIDKLRLRYDEFIADADAAFGDFMSGLEADGKLGDTAVIVSADHGESFQGGVYQHEHATQTVPEVHIPLIVRMPGQVRPRRVEFTADQTSLAPTILDIARLPRADWMRAPSLIQWLNSEPENGAAAAPGNTGRGMAFTEYLENSSSFHTPRLGTVGVTDGVHQYVYNLATRKGTLRNMDRPLEWQTDRSTQNPDAARQLREALHGRFPDLIGN